MNIEKKKLLIIGIAATIFILGITTVLAVTVFNEQSEEPNEEETASIAPEESQAAVIEDTAATGTDTDAKYTYYNLDGLYFVPSWEYDGAKTAIEEFLKVIEKTSISKIRVLDKIVTDDDILYTFWVLLDDDTILRGAYNYELDRYAFEIETDESIITKFIDTTEPDGTDDPNVSYAYADLTISNLKDLESVLPDEACQRFPDELISFLDSQHELRRYFTISDIAQDGTTVSWTCNFDTLRIDKMNVYVTYSTDNDIFTFSLQ